MTERQLIQEILNSVSVLYDFEDANEDSSEYTLLLKQQGNDTRSLETVNNEVKHYFEEADFTYKEELHPTNTDKPEDIRVEIKKV
ncbi:hypothetical protein [Secundilactobacillus malefermentans]|uniref:Uncharacterized protein n=1 Tax=Secundilactobacillus malefermentans TaxID=176292 RepID=A0A4R5NT16_9LACO|nr:hypothetical protein [Secundilactobacillus malefermentans]KRM59351.1 hypothetical protein FD44_GL001816 [Secundilactobacillus malefermentans DSM 5705 = KCTC 3548]QEA31724.1 hypothetical protein FGL90_05750 [Secundilactobacillus malefermentans]TDG79933.1 hypothetical protein C5L31_002152 [Secundilactobacillus malefermentans]